LIRGEEKNYDLDDIGDSDYRESLNSLQSWLENEGKPFERLLDSDVQYED